VDIWRALAHRFGTSFAFRYRMEKIAAPAGAPPFTSLVTGLILRAVGLALIGPALIIAGAAVFF
jgi:hypothetical protein